MWLKHTWLVLIIADCGDYVVVTNCQYLKFTGDKLQQKLYRSHTTRPGGLKEVRMDDFIQKKGHGEVLRLAVNGMLPKNRLRDRRIERLRVFDGPEHNHDHNITKVH